MIGIVVTITMMTVAHTPSKPNTRDWRNESNECECECEQETTGEQYDVPTVLARDSRIVGSNEPAGIYYQDIEAPKREAPHGPVDHAKLLLPYERP